MRSMLNSKNRTIEAPMSPARERLQAQIKIKKGLVAVMEDQVKARECSEADLQVQQRQVVALEEELARIDASEAFDRHLSERRRVELPQLETELQNKARRAARLLLEAREALNEVRAVHGSIAALADQKFPGFVVVPGVANRDLVALCGTGGHNSLVREMTSKGELLDRWLEQLKAAGVEI